MSDAPLTIRFEGKNQVRPPVDGPGKNALTYKVYYDQKTSPVGLLKPVTTEVITPVVGLSVPKRAGILESEGDSV